MNWEIFNKNVFYTKDPIIKIDAKTIELLKTKMNENLSNNTRLCTHKDLHDQIHEMFIVHTKSKYVRPHKHNSRESFYLIEGLAQGIFFDEEGKVNQIIPLGNYNSGRIFYYKIPENIYHTIIIESDTVVFYEVKKGPFNPSDTTFAPWAPIPNDYEKVKNYIAKLEYYVGRG